MDYVLNTTPSNQKRLTNVAYIRLMKGGTRFEIACYRNKVLSWRSKVETDLSEVLQAESVFTNVSKGNLASAKSLMDAFGSSDPKVVCREILDKGEMQVSEQERAALQENIFKDIARIVAEKTVNPDTNTPYTTNMIQNAMKQIQFSVHMSQAHRSSKSQALEVIKKLRDVMPIARAHMLVRITCPVGQMPAVQRELAAIIVQLISQDTDGAVAHTEILIDPEQYRAVQEVANEFCTGGFVEVVSLKAHNVAVKEHASAAPAATVATAVRVTPSASTAHAMASATEVYYENEEEEQSAEGEERMLAAQMVHKKKAGGGKLKRSEDEDAAMLAAAMESLAAGSGEENNNDGSGGSSSSDDEVVPLATVGKKSRDPMGMVKPSKGKKRKERKKKERERESLIVIDKESVQRVRDPDDVDVVLVDPGDYVFSSDLDSDDASDTTPVVEVEAEEGVDAATFMARNAATARTRSASIASTATSNSSVAGRKKAPIGPLVVPGEKKGKRAKRLEKEELAEQQKKALKLKARIIQQQQRKANEAIVEEDEGEEDEEKAVAAAAAVAPVVPATSAMPGAQLPAAALSKCNTCGGSFVDKDAYRAHFKSEWHRHNLSRKMKGKRIITSEEEFISLPVSELVL